MPDISLQSFYVVQFETALDVPYNNIPFEVTIIRFNLKDGELQHFHNFIDTGPLPNWFVNPSI